MIHSENTYPIILNDSLVVITPQQLKQTNLIFLEHNKLRLENIQLYKQVDCMENIIINNNEQLSIQEHSINTAVKELDNATELILHQNKELAKYKSKTKVFKGLTIGGITIGVTLLALLIAK